MISRRERLLAEFVNRDLEFEHFCRMLDAPDKPVFAIWAGSGLGKTWLVSRFVAECERRAYRAVLVDEHRHVNYLAVFRAIRDAVGAQWFSRFTDLVNYYTVKNYNLQINIANAAPIQVLQNADVKESALGDVAGIIVKDLNLTEPRSDMDVPEMERMSRLTAQFVEDFAVALASQPIVVFFDAAEKMPDVTREWVWGTLFGRYVAEGKLPRALFVLAGREKPTYERDLGFLVEARQLQPLQEMHVMDYLGKRGIPDMHRHVLARMLLAAAAGQPNLIAMHTDRFLELQQAQGT
jgi:hypothetical protein